MNRDRKTREKPFGAGVRQLTQAYQQAPWRGQVQVIGLFLVVLVFAAVVAAIYLNVTSRTATMGREIQMMQAKIEKNQQINFDLQARLAQITSSAEMEKRARALGFVPVKKDEIIYLRVQGYSGRGQAVLAPPPGPLAAGAPVLPSAFTKSLFDWLKEKISLNGQRFWEVLP